MTDTDLKQKQPLEEIVLLTAPAGCKGWMLKKAWRVLRRQGLAVFLQKARGKVRVTANKRFAYFKTESRAVLKTYLPAPLKNVLKALRNRMLQRRFISEKPTRAHAIASADVLFQVDNFLAGGLENVVLDQLVTFRDAGMNVALLVLEQPGEAARKAEQLGIPVVIMSYSEREYAALLDMVSPGLLLTHYSILGLELAAKNGIPVIQVIHNSYVWFTEQTRADFLASAQYTDMFIAVSNWVAEYSIKHLGLLPEKVCIIENGIELEKFMRPELAAEGKALRKELGFAETDVLFLSVSSIAQQKNPLGLVRAFHAAMSSCPDAKLALLGPVYDPLLRQEITKYCDEHGLREKVFYLGSSPDPAPYYAMADIFVHAAFFEGGQLCFLEALAMDLPCISTEVGFCKSRRRQAGVYLCLPPVDLLVSDVGLADLRPTDKGVQDLAECMRKAYIERARPSLSKQEIEKMDRRFTYAAYVKEVSQLLKSKSALSR
jgi:glycosyltransferase involved in cell wall biosynthesis